MIAPTGQTPAVATPVGLRTSAPIDHEREASAFLALSAIRGVGEKTLLDILEAGRSFGEVLEAAASDALPLLRRASSRADFSPSDWSSLRMSAREQAGRLGDLLRKMDVELIFQGDPRFPEALLELERPPRWLFVQGPPAVLSSPSVAIVGTRTPTEDGLFLARYVGACLDGWPAATVSGLASGIDQLAHESSLRAAVPTIAVLGTGILDNYPRGSGELRDRILAAGGVVISEYLPRASYSAANFVLRNRLQAALARVLIPVEWARRSGTAHTVRFASELDRPIACLRLPDWAPERVSLAPGLGEGSGRIFTLLREQSAFDAFVRAAVQGRPMKAPVQPSLFGDG